MRCKKSLKKNLQLKHQPSKAGVLFRGCGFVQKSNERQVVAKVKKKKQSKSVEPLKFKLIGKFKTGRGVEIEEGTVGTVIPHVPRDWVEPSLSPLHCCVRLAIPCKPGQIVISRQLVVPAV